LQKYFEDKAEVELSLYHQFKVENQKPKQLKNKLKWLKLMPW